MIFKFKKRTIRQFFFELVIVFVGVYLAFLFSELQEQRQELDVAVKFHQALIDEFQFLVRTLDHEYEHLDKELLPLIAEIERGGQPDLIPPHLFYNYPERAVSAGFNAKNFEALDQQLLMSLVIGSFGLRGLEARINRLDHYTRTLLLPALAYDKSFYDENGKLQTKYAWYPRLIQEINDHNRALRKEVTELALPYLVERRDQLSRRWF